MSSEMMQTILQMIGAEAYSRPTPLEFELAPQARVAIGRIKFAIRQAERFAPHSDQIREVGLQLLVGTKKLESAVRSVQQRLRMQRRLRSRRISASGGNGKVERRNPLEDV